MMAKPRHVTLNRLAHAFRKAAIEASEKAAASSGDKRQRLFGEASAYHSAAQMLCDALEEIERDAMRIERNRAD